jgi:hypothetical protein
MKYNLVGTGDTQNITVVHDGEMYVASQEHPNWTRIVEGVLADDLSVVDLFDVSKTVARVFEELSERVAVQNGRVYFDGDELNNALTQQIVRFLDEDVDDWAPLVYFLEKLQNNPNEHSREQLYRWLAAYDFTITSEGNFIAYKGVKPSENPDFDFESVSHGTAIVDGVEYTGAIPNFVGATVTMPRSAVQFDPNQGCSTGLHAGTWEYAKSFSRGAVLKVLIDPRDVVSVPTDSGDQKLRVCRYYVLEVIDAPVKEAVSSDTYDHKTDDDYDEADDGYSYTWSYARW